MKVEKILIKNYRAIQDLTVNLNYSINPLIGVNEAGKTTILKAILAFDKNRDKYNQGEHLNPKNKYRTSDTKDCTITAVLSISQEEIDNLINTLGLKTDSEDYSIISNFTPQEKFMLIRQLDSSTHSVKHKKYIYEHKDISENIKNKIKLFLIARLPILLYFDDFTDRVPESIPFPEDYKKNGQLIKTNKNFEWQEIIEEIFRRADTEGIEDDGKLLKYFFNITDRDQRDGVLYDIQDTLNREIIAEWKKVKQKGDNSLADDSDSLELEIDRPSETEFSFKVKDRSSENRNRKFNISERSKGFQWFFNYMIKLKFNPRYKGKQENSIFLLDEPGSYLHSSAQSELLKELKEVSVQNTIIYCTHSQFLLNPEYIKLGSIKIAEKKGGNIVLHEYGSYKTAENRGALTPIYQSLQLNYLDTLSGRIVITEGITDFYLFEMLRKHSDKISNEIKFVPGAGASNSSTLLSLAIPFSESFLIILDNDEAGRKAREKYINNFGEKIADFIHIYQKDKPKCELENLFSQGDVKRLKDITDVTDTKKALSILYYDHKSEHENFVKGISTKTLNNLTETFNAINEAK